MLGKRVPLDLAARSEEHWFHRERMRPLHDGNRPRSAITHTARDHRRRC